jgi:hypothetical protein
MLKNKLIIHHDSVNIEIKRKNGDIFYAIIDKECLPKFLEFNKTWYVKRQTTNLYYVCCTIYAGRKPNNKLNYITYGLHQFILDVEPENRIIKIDHINHQPLDNRKENLRTLTQFENMKNRKSKNKNNKTGHRNVCFVDGWYLVQLQVEGKCKCVGKFKDVDEAGAFAEQKRKELYGEFAGEN